MDKDDRKELSVMTQLTDLLNEMKVMVQNALERITAEC